MPGYDYDQSFRRGRRYTPRFGGWMPTGYTGDMPMYGWGWPGTPDDPYRPFGGGHSSRNFQRGYDRDFGGGYDSREFRTSRVSPRESPTFGRAGDRVVRRWATHYGYDFDMDRGRDPARSRRDYSGFRWIA